MNNNNNEQERISLEGEIKKVKGGYEIDTEESMPRRGGDKFLPISIIVAAIFICGAILFSVFYRPGSRRRIRSAQAPTTASRSQQRCLTSLMTLSSRDQFLVTRTLQSRSSNTATTSARSAPAISRRSSRSSNRNIGYRKSEDGIPRF